MLDVIFLRREKRGRIVVDRDGIDFISLADRIDYLLTFGHLTENRVPPVEVGRGVVSNKKLGTIRAWSRICHRENTCLGVFQIGMKLICEFVTRTTAPAASRIAALDHEIRNHAVKRNPVVITPFGEIQEIRASHRSF